jgi:hypothetical protein
MTKEVMYVYLGTNGTICSPIHLEDIYYIRKYRLWADKNKVLTKDNKNFVRTIIVSEDDIPNWLEINDTGLGQD